MYLPVDFLTPMLYMAATCIVAIFTVPLGISVLIRWKKFRADADGLQTYARRRDLRIQSGASILGCVVMLAASITAAVGWNESSRNLSANVEARYNVSDVKMTSWNGSWAEVDLVDGNGRPMRGIDALYNEKYEPSLQDPAFETGADDATEPALDLR